RLPAVADGVFLGITQLRGRTLPASGHEYGVVPETAPAAGSARDGSFPGAVRDERCLIPDAADPDDDGLVARLAKAIRHILELCEELPEVLLVARPLPGKAR